MQTFNVGVVITSGEGALDTLGELGIRSALVVCDPFMSKSGTVHAVTDRLEAAGARCSVFDGVVPDPTVAVVSAAVAELGAMSPDAVVALGGGSAIDTAKAAAYIYAQAFRAEMPQLVAIPTTSGTGSEATSFAVISDPDAGTKYPLVSDDLLPARAILDPTLTVTVPAPITADTGLDVLTHAIEAYVATGATDMTDALAEKAAAVVFECLAHAVKHGDDLAARERLQNASCMAGVAFNGAGLGLCHAMAHSLGARVHLPHGRCNAVLLPHIVRFNAADPRARSRYARIAARVGCCSVSEQIAVEGLIRKIEQLMAACGIDPHIDSERAASLREGMAEVSAAALKDRCYSSTPLPASAEQIAELYGKIC